MATKQGHQDSAPWTEDSMGLAPLKSFVCDDDISSTLAAHLTKELLRVSGRGRVALHLSAASGALSVSFGGDGHLPVFGHIFADVRAHQLLLTVARTRAGGVMQLVGETFVVQGSTAALEANLLRLSVDHPQTAVPELPLDALVVDAARAAVEEETVEAPRDAPSALVDLDDLCACPAPRPDASPEMKDVDLDVPSPCAAITAPSMPDTLKSSKKRLRAGDDGQITHASMDIGRPSDGATAARKKIAVRRRPLAATVAVREQAPPTGGVPAVLQRLEAAYNRLFLQLRPTQPPAAPTDARSDAPAPDEVESPRIVMDSRGMPRVVRPWCQTLCGQPAIPSTRHLQLLHRGRVEEEEEEELMSSNGSDNEEDEDDEAMPSIHHHATVDDGAIQGDASGLDTISSKDDREPGSAAAAAAADAAAHHEALPVPFLPTAADKDIVVCRASDAAPSTLSDDSADWETRGDVVSALVAGVHLTALAADTTPPADQPGPAAPAAAATAAAGDAAIEDAVDGVDSAVDPVASEHGSEPGSTAHSPHHREASPFFDGLGAFNDDDASAHDTPARSRSSSAAPSHSCSPLKRMRFTKEALEAVLEDEREEKEQAVARTVAAEEALARAHEASGEERAALEADRDAAREHVERVEAELERLTHEKDAAEAALVAERLAHQAALAAAAAAAAAVPPAPQPPAQPVPAAQLVADCAALKASLTAYLTAAGLGVKIEGKGSDRTSTKWRTVTSTMPWRLRKLKEIGEVALPRLADSIIADPAHQQQLQDFVVEANLAFTEYEEAKTLAERMGTQIRAAASATGSKALYAGAVKRTYGAWKTKADGNLETLRALAASAKELPLP